MAKYLRSIRHDAQCRPSRISRKAALWAVHQAMQQVLPMEDDGWSHLQAKSEKVIQPRRRRAIGESHG